MRDEFSQAYKVIFDDQTSYVVLAGAPGEAAERAVKAYRTELSRRGEKASDYRAAVFNVLSVAKIYRVFV